MGDDKARSLKYYTLHTRFVTWHPQKPQLILTG